LESLGDAGDSECLEGDIVDKIFNQKGTSAHLELDFQAAAKFVRGLAATAKQEDLLYFYARYKQVTVGPCNTAKPSFYQLTEKAKWSAWSELGEMGRVEAQLQYLARLGELQPDWAGREAGPDPAQESWVAVSSLVREQEVEAGQETVWDHARAGCWEPLAGLSLPLAQHRDTEGLTLLHWAADRGQAELAARLLEREPGLLDVQDSEGQTALHYAASCGHPALVELLLRAGADTALLDSDGVTACNGDTEPDIRKLFRIKTD